MSKSKTKPTPIFIKKHFLNVDFHNPIKDLLQNPEYKKILDDEIHNITQIYNTLLLKKDHKNYQRYKMLHPFFWFPVVEREEWLYITCYSAMILEFMARMHTKYPTLYWGLIYTIDNILRWWIVDSYYATWQEWQKLLTDVRDNKCDEDLYELFQELTSDLTKNWDNWVNELNGVKSHIIRMDRINENLPDNEKRPIINPYNKPREYIVLPEYLKDYKNVYWDVWSKEAFQQILVVREFFTNDEFLLSALCVLCYDINLYLYYCPYTKDVRISDSKNLQLNWDDVYVVINFTNFMRNVMRLDNDDLMKISKQDWKLDPEKVKEMVSGAVENLLNLKPDWFAYKLECLIEDKSRFQEVNSFLKVWNVWYTKDNREKKKIVVSQEDDYKTYIKREKRLEKKKWTNNNDE